MAAAFGAPAHHRHVIVSFLHVHTASFCKNSSALYLAKSFHRSQGTAYNTPQGLLHSRKPQWSLCFCWGFYKLFVVQGAEKVKAAQQEAEALKRETALAAAALEGRTQALARQEAAAAEAKALLAVRTKELDNREVKPRQRQAVIISCYVTVPTIKLVGIVYKVAPLQNIGKDLFLIKTLKTIF